MDAIVEQQGRQRGIPIETVDAAGFTACRRRLDARARRWLEATGFEPRPGRFVQLPDATGRVVRVLAGVDRSNPLWSLAALPWQLPPARHVLADAGVLTDGRLLAALGWALGAYRYTEYRHAGRDPAQLLVDAETLARLHPLTQAVTRVRDLVNTPTADLGPEQLAGAVKALGKTHKARVREWIGEALLKDNFPTIHAVGRASPRAPRLVELRWGKPGHPKLTLVGKGVCFDTGGLDLKPSSGMRWMKKDMGGAAHAIALAGLVMQARLPVQLTLLIPAVENSVAGDAMRPGDVLRTRVGHSVEIDNTDAEGRLILCDALAYAVEAQPDLLIDFATLTGAARVALGPDIPALFSNRDGLADAVLAAAREQADPLWRLPLWTPYHSLLGSGIADFANAGPSRHAGAITAALYLQRFVPESTAWMHVDAYAWNDNERPGRPAGGEAQGLRAFFAFLQQRYA